MTRLGIPYPANNPLGYLVDDEVVSFDIDKRQDLTGTGAEAAPIVSTGLFIVHQHVVPDNTGEVVMNVFPHCWRRINVGLATETVQLIPPSELAGFVLFDNDKANNQPRLVEHDYNSPTIAATPNNRDREVVRGTTFLGLDQPSLRDFGMQNEYALIYLPPKTIFRVLFRLTPTAGTAPIPNPFVIPPDVPAVATQRIDFAGAYVSGVRMPAQTYDKLKIARRIGQLGPEGSWQDRPGTAR